MEEPEQSRSAGRTPVEKPREEEAPAAATEGTPVAIAGIGASAGGLVALEAFFAHVPRTTGIAYVVVTHQAPDQPSSLPEILQRSTTLPVVKIEDGMRAQPDTVYIVPPSVDLLILHGTFTLIEQALHQGMRLPIDTFFRQLAEDQEERAVGIVLSGMGSDGTLGVRALKEHMGMVMVQEPGTAKFGAMPQSALATGLVDYSAPAEELPNLLFDYVQHQARVPWAPPPHTGQMESTLTKIFALIRTRTGQDFTFYKRNTIVRRIERRMGLHQIARIEDYIQYLREKPGEVETLARELRIGVTQFFRDPDAWRVLQETVFPDLISSRSHGETLRVWIVGCSTGEEAYSMAIALHETLNALQRHGDIRIQIFATELDADAIETARLGRYPANISADVSPERLERFFVREGDSYRVRPEIRETVVFAVQNVISDPPFTRLDVLSCRNLLIYLSPEIQRRLIPLFHYALNPGGILFLGAAETIGEHSDLFSAVDTKNKIFVARRDGSTTIQQIGLPGSWNLPETAGRARSLQPQTAIPVGTLTQQELLRYYAPPAVIITKNGDILYVYGRTGKYLEMPTGRADLNIFTMAREEFRYQITTAIQTAIHKKADVTGSEITVGDGGLRKVTVTVRPVRGPPGTGDLLMVTFEESKESEEEQSGPARAEVSGPNLEDAAWKELEQELAQCREQRNNTMEAMQTSQEEMKSMYEELQSTNEEIQSTNEELTTSKEELQSLNEELMTVNAELQTKIIQLTQTTDDMATLLRSTEIGMVFLDTELRVRRFTEPATRIVNLIPSDVGRPVTDLGTNVQDGNSVFKNARQVLDTLAVREKQVQVTNGDWYLMRILPYRTSDNRIDGVAITFVDITEIKHLEQSLQESTAYAESIISTIREALIVLDADLRVVSANRSFYEMFQTTPGETEGRNLYALGDNQWDIPELRHLLEEILPRETQFEGFAIDHTFPGIGRHVMRLNARQLRAPAASKEMILLAIEDTTGVPMQESQNTRDGSHRQT
ncbi:chemotaxis protein CheB [Methanoculleus sp.]|uniref:chemotaxis protein CheB n=1 Tax=Methanoculleus sp. TaxID=90427 RepID=UPI001BD5DE8A|nr:chemotaxis protein CheB [Methanoculleus sp.]